MINDILKPITDEKGPFADLIPNETQMKSKILFNILNDDGEPTLDKEGNEIKKLNKQQSRMDSPTPLSPSKRSEISLSKNQSYISYQDSNMAFSPKKMRSERSSSESDFDSPIAEKRNESNVSQLTGKSRFKESFNKSEPMSLKNKPPAKSSTFKIPIENFQETDEDQKFFSQSEKLLKV